MDRAAGTSASSSRSPNPWNSGTRASSARLRSGVSAGAGTTVRLAERCAQRCARLRDGVARLVEPIGHAEEPVEHARIARGADLDARLAKPRGVGLSLVAQRVVPRRDAQAGWQAVELRGAQRRCIALASLFRIREIL